MFASPTVLLLTLQRTLQPYTINCIVVCVSQRNAHRLWCASDMLCPKASVQADPPPWLQSSHSFFMSRSEYAALHLSPHLFSLPTWRLWAPPAESLGSEGTLHERKPAAFTVWCFRASTGGGECAVAGRQWKHFWHCQGGWEAPYQPQVIIRISYSPCEEGISSSESLDPVTSEDPDVPDTMTHTHSQSSTHHHEAVSAVWLISKLQPEYFETSNPETLPNGNFHISRIQKKRHTRTHTSSKWKRPQSGSSRQTHRLSSQLCTPSKMLKYQSCAVLYLMLNTQMHLKVRTFVSVCMENRGLRSSSGTVSGTGSKPGPKDVNCN